MNRFLLFIFICLPLGLWGQSHKPVNPIQFQIKNAGITVDGTIADWEVELNFDAKKLPQSSIRGTANPTTIDTGIKLRDMHLLGRQYFHTEKYPKISLQSKSFKSIGKNGYVGIFELQIRDVKREIEIPFSVTTNEKQRKFKGEFTIDRMDFGLGENSLVLSDEVRVLMEF